MKNLLARLALVVGLAGCASDNPLKNMTAYDYIQQREIESQVRFNAVKEFKKKDQEKQIKEIDELIDIVNKEGATK